jgi:hypothetical protein
MRQSRQWSVPRRARPLHHGGVLRSHGAAGPATARFSNRNTYIRPQQAVKSATPLSRSRATDERSLSLLMLGVCPVLGLQHAETCHSLVFWGALFWQLQRKCQPTCSHGLAQHCDACLAISSRVKLWQRAQTRVTYSTSREEPCSDSLALPATETRTNMNGRAGKHREDYSTADSGACRGTGRRCVHTACKHKHDTCMQQKTYMKHP